MATVLPRLQKAYLQQVTLQTSFHKGKKVGAGGENPKYLLPVQCQCTWSSALHKNYSPQYESQAKALQTT